MLISLGNLRGVSHMSVLIFSLIAGVTLISGQGMHSDEEDEGGMSNNSYRKDQCQCCLSCSDAPQAIHPAPTVYPPECFTKCTYVVTKYTAFISRKCKCPKDIELKLQQDKNNRFRLSDGRGEDDEGVGEDESPNVNKKRHQSRQQRVKEPAYEDVLNEDFSQEEQQLPISNSRDRRDKQDVTRRHTNTASSSSTSTSTTTTTAARLSSTTTAKLTATSSRAAEKPGEESFERDDYGTGGEGYDGAGGYGGYDDDDDGGGRETTTTTVPEAAGGGDAADLLSGLDEDGSATETSPVSRGRRAPGTSRREPPGCPPNPFDVCKPRKCRPKPTVAPRTKADEELDCIMEAERKEMGLPPDPCIEPPTTTPKPPCPMANLGPNRQIGPCGRLGPGYLSAYGVNDKTEYRVIYRAKNLTYEVVFPSLVEWESLDFDKYQKKRITGLVARSGGLKSIMRAYSSVYALEDPEDSNFIPPCMRSSSSSSSASSSSSSSSSSSAWTKRNTNESWSPDTPEAKESCVISSSDSYGMEPGAPFNGPTGTDGGMMSPAQWMMGYRAGNNNNNKVNGPVGFVSQLEDAQGPDLRISYPNHPLYQRMLQADQQQGTSERPSFLFPTTRRPYELGIPETPKPITQQQGLAKREMFTTASPALLDPRNANKNTPQTNMLNNPKFKRSNENNQAQQLPSTALPPFGKNMPWTKVAMPTAIPPLLPPSGIAAFDPVAMSLADWTVPGPAGAMELTPEMRKQMIMRRQQEFMKQYMQQWFTMMTYYAKMKQQQQHPGQSTKQGLNNSIKSGGK